LYLNVLIKFLYSL